MDGNKIKMSNPLSDDLVSYSDGTKATEAQMAKDVTTFLTWAAEPHLEERHKLGFKVIPSHGNFILTSHAKIQAKRIFTELKKNKVLVRHFNKDKIRNWLRISIGTKRECEKLLKVLRAIIL